jgi:hypothetical protein
MVAIVEALDLAEEAWHRAARSRFEKPTIYVCESGGVGESEV